MTSPRRPPTYTCAVGATSIAARGSSMSANRSAAASAKMAVPRCGLHSGIIPARRAIGSELDGDRERRPVSDSASPKDRGRGQHATQRRLRATAGDSTRGSLPPNGGYHSGRPRRPSLSKVRPLYTSGKHFARCCTARPRDRFRPNSRRHRMPGTRALSPQAAT